MQDLSHFFLSLDTFESVRIIQYCLTNILSSSICLFTSSPSMGFFLWDGLSRLNRVFCLLNSMSLPSKPLTPRILSTDSLTYSNTSFCTNRILWFLSETFHCTKNKLGVDTLHHTTFLTNTIDISFQNQESHTTDNNAC